MVWAKCRKPFILKNAKSWVLKRCFFLYSKSQCISPIFLFIGTLFLATQIPRPESGPFEWMWILPWSHYGAKRRFLVPLSRENWIVRANDLSVRPHPPDLLRLASPEATLILSKVVSRVSEVAWDISCVGSSAAVSALKMAPFCSALGEEEIGREDLMGVGACSSL